MHGGCFPARRGGGSSSWVVGWLGGAEHIQLDMSCCDAVCCEFHYSQPVKGGGKAVAGQLNSRSSIKFEAN